MVFQHGLDERRLRALRALRNGDGLFLHRGNDGEIQRDADNGDQADMPVEEEDHHGEHGGRNQAARMFTSTMGTMPSMPPTTVVHTPATCPRLLALKKPMGTLFKRSAMTTRRSAAMK